MYRMFCGASISYMYQMEKLFNLIKENPRVENYDLKRIIEEDTDPNESRCYWVEFDIFVADGANADVLKEIIQQAPIEDLYIA